MTLALDKVHEFRSTKDPITGATSLKLVRIRPCIRLSENREPPIFIQDGKFYFEGGEEATELPAWVHDAIDKMSDEAKREVKLPVQNLDNEPDEAPKRKRT